jgi:hypothetical protein
MAIKYTNIFQSEALQNEPKLGFWFENVLSCNPLNLNKLNDIDEKICIGSYICITKQVTNQVSVLIPFIKIK